MYDEENVQSCSILRSFGKLIISKSFQLKLFERNVTRSIAIDAMFLCVNIHVYLFCVFFICTQPHFIDTNYAMLNYFL